MAVLFKLVIFNRLRSIYQYSNNNNNNNNNSIYLNTIQNYSSADLVL